MVSIKSPLYLYEVGRRNNNEDSIYPLADRASADDRLFLVCDGVGGSEKGEVASALVCRHVPEYLAMYPIERFDRNYLDQMLTYVEAKLSEHIAENPQCKGMATTLTLLYFTESGANVAWCGDSRVYQFRGGQIKYETEDHSLVAEMIRRGELSEQEAETHPQKNVILRAISGSDKPSKLDFITLEDISAGDRFLLCSDGILEAFNSQDLCTLNNHGMMDIFDMRDAIAIRCAERSRDNHAMYLLEIEAVQGAATAEPQKDAADVSKVSGATQEPGRVGTKTKELAQAQTAASRAAAADKSNSSRAILGLIGAALILTFTIGGLKMAELSTDSEYNKYLAEGTEEMLNQDWPAAKISFQNAIELKPDDNRAFEQLEKIRKRERQIFVTDSIDKAREKMERDSLLFGSSDSLGRGDVDSLSVDSVAIEMQNSLESAKE